MPRRYPMPDARIRTAAAFARPHMRFADVGCDHGYLCCYLCGQDETVTGIASDLRPQPLARAAENLRLYGFDDRVETRLCAGLTGMENACLRDIFILGMGAETVIEILSAAAFVKDPACRLILQPMTHAELLRAWLLANGFTIVDERLAAARGVVYAVMCAAAADGGYEPYTDTELLLGRAVLARRAECPELFRRYLAPRLRAVRNRLHGLMKGGYDTAKTASLYEELCALDSTGNPAQS